MEAAPLPDQGPPRTDRGAWRCERAWPSLLQLNFLDHLEMQCLKSRTRLEMPEKRGAPAASAAGRAAAPDRPDDM